MAGTGGHRANRCCWWRKVPDLPLSSNPAATSAPLASPVRPPYNSPHIYNSRRAPCSLSSLVACRQLAEQSHFPTIQSPSPKIVAVTSIPSHQTWNFLVRANLVDALEETPIGAREITQCKLVDLGHALDLRAMSPQRSLRVGSRLRSQLTFFSLLPYSVQLATSHAYK